MSAGSDLHVVGGAGAVGRAVAAELVERGLPVRVIARRPVMGLPPTVDVVLADLADQTEARSAMAGATVVYHTAAPAYHQWRAVLPPLLEGILAGVGAVGAKLVYADNLYAYGPVDGALTEDRPERAAGPNGRLRAALAQRVLDAHARGVVRATIGRASDYYGPHGRQSTAGDVIFGRAVRGQSAQVLGDPDLPHTYTYLGDFARGLVTLGLEGRALGEVWHVPSADTISTRQFVELVFDAAGRAPAISRLPGLALAAAALVSPTMRAVREQQYQRTRPWVVDHSKFTRAFGGTTTPHADAIAATLRWFRNSAPHHGANVERDESGRGAP